MRSNTSRIRSLYESYLSHNPDGTPRASNPGAARQAFQNAMRHRMGLCDQNGNNYTDPLSGYRVLRECQDVNARLNSRNLTFRELGEGMVPGLAQFMESAEDFAAWARTNYAYSNLHPNDPRALLEAPGVGVSPSAFADINAWTAINSGLIERRILEAFVNPEFLGNEICPPEQTRIAEGQKVIGASRIGPKGQRRDPGGTHPRATIQERWVQLPRTNELALAIDVTFEAAWFDLTGGQVLDHAGNVGEWLSYGQELDQIDAVLGVNGSTGRSTDPNAFNYKGTAFALANTNPQTATQPMPINSQSNPITNGDWTTIKSAWLQSKRVYDPETLTRVRVSCDTILTGLEGALTADLIVGATDTERRTTIGQTTPTQSGAGTLTVQRTPENLARTRFGVNRVLTSELVDQRMTDTTGLNLSAVNAAAYWFYFQRGKSHKLMVNWPLTLSSVPAGSSYEMTDRRIIQSTFASLRYTPSVWSPWHWFQNTN